MQVTELTREEYSRALEGLCPNPPIEQLPAWQDYEETVPDRSFWGYLAFERDGETVALAALMQYETHGYRFLRGHHAPVWGGEPTAELEEEALAALASFVRRRDGKQAFARLGVLHDVPSAHPVLSTRPYDSTVIIDLTGGDEEILARMKTRGRRDVRKALRECALSFSDETERAAASFDEYYDVMRETAERDGFVPAPQADYEAMMRILGPEHCRLFAGRDGDRVVTWTMATISGTRATRYYGASRSGRERALATDRLIYFECCELSRRGCTEYDQMGIGSEEFPDLQTLNTFKTKFAKDGVRHVAPDRDVPFKRAFYAALTGVRDLRDRVRRTGN